MQIKIIYLFQIVIKLNKNKKIFICCTEQSGENIVFNICQRLKKYNFQIDGVGGKSSEIYFTNKFYDISLFKSLGLIEILKQPDNKQEFNLGLDHRSPKGSFMVIETSNIETIFSKYKKKDINFKQDLTIQDWGHKSFSINDPNGVVLFFFENVE